MTLSITFLIHSDRSPHPPQWLIVILTSLNGASFRVFSGWARDTQPKTNRVPIVVCILLNCSIFNDHVKNKATRLPIILKQSSRTIHMHVMGVSATLDGWESSVCGNTCIPQDICIAWGTRHTHPFWTDHLLKMSSPWPGCDKVVSVCKIKFWKEQRERATEKKLNVFYMKCKPFLLRNVTLCSNVHLLNLPKYVPEN